MQRALLLGLIGAAAAFLWWSGAELLDFDSLKARAADFSAWRAASPWRAAALFFTLYVAVTALSLPGAAVLTLAAGALFGFWQGLLLASFASSLGALLAFLSARYLLRDWLRARLQKRLERLDAGVRRDGAYYLLTLRLVPVVPFFVINLALGLTAMRAITFYWVSQIGMLAGTAIYVNAGTELAALTGPADVLNARVLLALALLASLPWLGRMLRGALERRRRYRGFTRPSRFDSNLLIIGAGAAGLVSAYLGAQLKAKVTLVEGHKLGGDCLNYGCVPSKTLLHSARVANTLREAGLTGVQVGEPQVVFAQVMSRVRAAVERIAPHDSRARYEALGVEVLEGHARLISPWEVDISLADGSTVRRSARAIVLATGSRPRVPDFPGLQAVPYVTTETLWTHLASQPAPPRRVVVLGGGAVGVELAFALQSLGSQVRLLQRGERLLPREDDDVAAAAAASLTAAGVVLEFGVNARACSADPTPRLHGDNPGGAAEYPFELLLIATGRAPRWEQMGLEDLDLLEDGDLVLNQFLQTRLPNIFAAGDVTRTLQYTHVAGHQGWYAAVNGLLGGWKKLRPDHRVIPRCVFIEPEIACVGLTEQAAQAQGVAYEVTRFDLEELDRAIAEGANRGFIKVLTVPGKDRILGVALVGRHAGELVAQWTLAMRHGLGLKQILATVHAYPTWSEANKLAAGAWRREHTPTRLMPWLERYHSWRRG